MTSNRISEERDWDESCIIPFWHDPAFKNETIEEAFLRIASEFRQNQQVPRKLQ